MGLRWIFALLCVAVWAYIAIANGWWWWRREVRKEPHSPSTTPLLGAVFAFVAYLLLPMPGDARLLLLFLALLLDYGSVPYLARFAFVMLRGEGRK